MKVAVTVEVEDLECDGCQCRKKALSAFFTMVSLDKEGKPNLVPELVLDTFEEIDAFKEGQQRYDNYKLKKSNKVRLAHTELSCKL